MLQFTITISDEEEKALLGVMADIEDWTNNAIHNRARQAIDRVILEFTDRQPKKLSIQERTDIIKGLTIETTVQRADRLFPKLEV